MSTLLPILIATGVLLVVAVFAFKGLKAQRKEWQDLAARRGWRLEDEAGMRAFSAQSQVLKHFALGMRSWTDNVVSGQHRERRIWLSELSYQRHTGKHHKTAYQTICVIEWQGLEWPQLVLHNKGDDNYLRTFLRDSPMPMLAAPEANDGFELWGTDLTAAQTLMGPARRQEITRLGQPELHVEAHGPWLLVHRGKTVTAAEADSLIQDAFAVGDILVRQ